LLTEFVSCRGYLTINGFMDFQTDHKNKNELDIVLADSDGGRTHKSTVEKKEKKLEQFVMLSGRATLPTLQ
jgi:hypothetical protein